ncbi:MAG TPA: T9SS type A sorting domain-containing protein [Crocinitomicaceae bacterium]|nr:T9SS type A sorting domain-containing protein [Crocinitomicaceae bacterium]
MIKKLLPIFILVASQSFAQVEVYNEDFQSGLPLTYTIVDNDGLTPNAAIIGFDNAWVQLVDPMNSTDTIVGSTSFFDPTGRADRWLITPPITIGAYGNILSWEAKSHDPSFPDDYFVLISTTDTQITSFTDTLYAIINELASWQLREVNISDSGYVNQTVHIAFVNRTINGFKLYLDDIIMVKEDPVGLSEKSINKISVYPNPSNSFVTISGDNLSPTVKVFSLAGELLIESNGNQVDLSMLQNGNYLLEAISNGVPVRTTIVKL